MQAAVGRALGAALDAADALVMAAAVGDYRPTSTHDQKLKRTADALQLGLTPNPDILAAVGAARRGVRPVLVGFAVEAASDAQVLAYARAKLDSKRVDVVVANHAADAFGKDDNRVTLVTRDGAQPLAPGPKSELADPILDFVAKKLEEQG
jgi:phosphopantothenoylcysteine decarboxylase/phosphopantothenate--cysteine ligase